MTFNGFISYSHAADGRLAPAVQRGLHRLARPWHRRRALWIFRDQTGLAVTPGLWSSIQTALDGSEYFVLLASPEAARSPWVNREIEHWMATKSAERILPVVTDGEWSWDTGASDFAEDSTAVPPALRGVFSEEPFFLDLRWARGSEHLTLQHSRFRDAIAQLAAPMHGISKDELEGEDVRQHRRARRLRSGAVVTLVVLALLASVTGVSAVRNAARAEAAAAEALRQKQVADDERDSAERSADEASKQEELARQQQIRATEASAEAEESERAARRQQRLADDATAEAQRQQRLADQAKVRTREQEQRAKAAFERAQRLQAQAQRLAEVAAEQRRLADQATAEAAKQQAKADQQKRIAVSRRLMNEATTGVADDPKTALMLGAAAQRLNPDAVTGRQLTGVVTATNFAGTLGNVTTAVYGPDGVLAGRGTDGRVALWRLTTPSRPVRLATLPDTGTIDGLLAFSSDGKTLAVVNAKHEAVLWNVADTSRPVRVATLPNDRDGYVSAVAFGRNRFVTGDDRGIVKLWDLTDRAHPTLLNTLDDFAGYPVSRLALTADGRVLIVDKERFVPVYDLADPADPRNLNVILAFGALPMTFSPDGSELAVGDVNGTVAVYDMTGRVPALPQKRTMSEDPTREPPPPLPDTDEPEPDPVERLTGLTGVATTVTYSPDGGLLAVGDRNGSVRVWDRSATASPGVVRSLQARGAIKSLSFGAKAGTLVTADGSSTATVWSVAAPGTPDRLGAVAVPGSRARATVFRPDGRTLVTAGSDGTASTWNTANPGRPVRGADLSLHKGGVRSVAFSPDFRTVAAVDAANGTLTVAATAQPTRPTTLTALPGKVGGTNAMAFSRDGRTLAVVADAATLMLWDVPVRGRPVLLSRLTGAAFGASVAFSPDGRTLATSSGDDPAITLWAVADRSAPARVAVLTGHSDDVESVAFSPNGRYLASGSTDRTTVLWDVADRVRPLRLAALAGHGGAVLSVTFSADGRTLATTGSDYSVMLWDTANPAGPIRLATTRTASGATAAGAVFRPDGRTLAVVSQPDSRAATVTLWGHDRLNSLRADPARSACAVAGRGLTAAEWARLVPEIPYRRTCPQ